MRGRIPNMDRVLEHINANADKLGFTAQYATLAEYYAALNASRARPLRWPRLERHDLLPYALDVGTAPLGGPEAHVARPPQVQQNWWTGEFTSWPLMKKMTRAGAAVLRGAEQLYATALLRTPRRVPELRDKFAVCFCRVSTE